VVAFYSYPKEHRTYLRTSNIVESRVDSVRLRTEASKRYKKIEGATAMIWKPLMVAERNFRRIKGTDLMIKVAEGVRCTDGVETPPDNKSVEYKQAV
jgi:putative transposase